jgi:transcriptional regulator with XRE-family HTH domain
MKKETVTKVKLSSITSSAKIKANPMAIIGLQLIELRKKAGLTQAQVTVISKLTPKRIVDLEQGRTNYTIESLLSYLAALGEDISSLKLDFYEAWALKAIQDPAETKRELKSLEKTAPGQVAGVVAAIKHHVPTFIY